MNEKTLGPQRIKLELMMRKISKKSGDEGFYEKEREVKKKKKLND